MEIKTNGKRNIELPYVSDKQRVVLKDVNGEIVSYIKTGKNSGRITGIVPDVVFAELEEVPLRPVNSSALNIAKTLDLTNEVGLILEKQNAIRQAFGSVLDFKAEIEDRFLKNKEQTDIALSELAEVARNTGIINDERYEEITAIDSAQNIDIEKIYSICRELSSKASLIEIDVNNITNVLNAHEHEKQTKESLGLGKVDNTSDIDKPVSKAVQEALDEKVSKEELTEFAEYIERLKKRQGEIEDGIQSLGGICANPIPNGGREGQILMKRSDLDGDYWWSNTSGTEAASEEKLGVAKIATIEDAKQGIDDTKIMTPLKVKTVLSDEIIKLNSEIDANADAILKTRNDLQAEIDDNAGDVAELQAETTTIKNDLNGLGDQVSGIEEKIPDTASATNQLADKAFVNEKAKEIKESMANVYKFKGSVNTFDDLPTAGNEVGDVYNIIDTDKNYAWDGSKWDDIGGTVDLSLYATKEYVDTTEQEIITDFMDADTALQTQITGISGVLAEEQNKIEAIEGKIPSNASSTNLLVATSELTNATQDVRSDFASADTALQTQITGLSEELDAEQDKIATIEGKIPTNASSSNLLSTATDLLNATQKVRSDFAEADSELQTQINGQATAIAGKQDKLTAGENIKIENNVISATGGSAVSSLSDIAIAGDNIVFAEGGDRYSVVGTPTIVDNVASFTRGNYITTDNVLAKSGLNSFEMVLAFEVPALSSTMLFSTTSPSTAPYMRGQITANGQFVLYYTDANDASKTVPFSTAFITANSKVYFKIVFDGSTGTMTRSYSTDGKSWQGEVSTAGFTAPKTNDGSVLIWGSSGATGTNFTGKFYLDESYIKTNLETFKFVETKTTISNVIKIWVGTKDEYDALAVKDSETLYNITDDAGPSQKSSSVVDSGKSDNKWYRVWSDGWIEQGGSTYGQSLPTSNTVTFLKAFKDTSYTLQVNYNIKTSNVGAYAVGYDNKTINSFITRGPSSATKQDNAFDWYACGY
jgi:predicted amino acid-binding ACT domain protein